MRDRFDVFLEALRHNLNNAEEAGRALHAALQAVEDHDNYSQSVDDQAEADIHYADRYGKGE